MKIEQKDPNNLIEYAFNNRVHSDDQVDMIANSIKNFGFNQPIVIDEDNIILVGHGRLRAAKKLGLSHVPVLQLKDLDEVKKRAYRILDNKLAADSEWSAEGLNIELPWLETEGFDLEAWGLDELKLDFEEPKEITDDEFEPTEQKNIYIKKGDLIELGRHRVLCGDSTKEEEVSELMNGNLADLLITDPPYGVNHVGGTKDPTRKTYRSGGEIINDDLGIEGTRDLVSRSLKNAGNNSKKGCAAYIACPAGTPLPHFIEAMANIFMFRHSLVWVKNAFVFSRADYHYRHEIILYGWKDDGAHYFCDDRTQDTVFEFDRGDKNIPHPTSKPLGLWAKLINNSSKEKEIVLDLFLGSGTTLIAAEQLNRTCYGMEISPNYCQVIIERYHKYCIKNEIQSQIKVNGEPLDLNVISQL